VDIWKSFTKKNNHLFKREMNELQLEEIERIDRIMSKKLTRLNVKRFGASTRYKNLTGYTFIRKCIGAKNCATNYKLRIHINDASYFIYRENKCRH